MVEESEDRNENSNKEEEQMLMEFISFQNLGCEDTLMHNSDECRLSALHACEGIASKEGQKSCIDCQLNNHKEYPSPE